MKAYRINLIRHGYTKGNENGQYIGKTDLPLTASSKEEIAQVGKKYKLYYSDLFYASPQIRAMQTMNILFPDTEFYQVQGFRELNFGEWEGKTAQDLKNDSDFAMWIQNGCKTTPPKGESNADFGNRVCGAFENIVDNMMKTENYTATIVASGGVIMTLLTAYGYPKHNFFDWMCPVGTGYTILIDPRLWMTENIVEVFDLYPSDENIDDDYYYDHPEEYKKENDLINLAREAGYRAYGDGEE